MSLARDIVIAKAFGGGGGGGGGGVLVVNASPDAGNPDLYVCDKTAGEMFAADAVVIVSGTTKTLIIEANHLQVNNSYAFTDCWEDIYTAASADAYPSCDMS